MLIDDIFIEPTMIKFEMSVRNPEVWLDSKLSSKDHIFCICKRAKNRKRLVETLLYPLVDCCCSVYNDLSVALDMKLQRVVNFGICYIHGLTSEHIFPYRVSLGWLTVCVCRNLLMLHYFIKL